MTRPCTANPAPFDRLIDLHTTGNRITRETYFNAREARTICGGCPIRDTCWAQNRAEPWVDAILRAKDRPKTEAPKPPPAPCTGCGKQVRNLSGKCADCRAAVRSFTADDPRHGTQQGYTQHKLHGEEPCQPCREGWTTYQRESRARRRAKAAERAGEVAA